MQCVIEETSDSDTYWVKFKLWAVWRLGLGNAWVPVRLTKSQLVFRYRCYLDERTLTALGGDVPREIPELMSNWYCPGSCGCVYADCMWFDRMPAITCRRVREFILHVHAVSLGYPPPPYTHAKFRSFGNFFVGIDK